MYFTREMVEFLMLVFSFLGCLSLMATIHDFFHKKIERKEALRLFLASIFLIVGGEFISGFILTKFIYHNPLIKSFFI